MDHDTQGMRRYQKHVGARTLSAQGCISNLPLLNDIFNSKWTPLRAFRNSVIVSFDLEYNCATHQIYEIGLSILDTCHLASIDTDDISSIASSVSSPLLSAKPTTSKSPILLRQPDGCRRHQSRRNPTSFTGDQGRERLGSQRGIGGTYDTC